MFGPGKFIWTENALRWKGRLDSLMIELCGGEDTGSYGSFITAAQRNQVTRRLLMLHLGVRTFQLENRRVPNALTELVPAHLPALPFDPYGNGSFVYRRNAEGFLLYSVGPDGLDDGGKRSAHDDNFTATQKGDLFLESIFTPEEDKSGCG